MAFVASLFFPGQVELKIRTLQKHILDVPSIAAGKTKYSYEGVLMMTRIVWQLLAANIVAESEAPRVIECSSFCGPEPRLTWFCRPTLER